MNGIEQRAGEIIVEAESVDGVPTAPRDIVYLCNECASLSDRFRCRCPKCGEYNTLEETDRKDIPRPPRLIVPYGELTHERGINEMQVTVSRPFDPSIEPLGPLMSLGQGNDPFASDGLVSLGDLEGVDNRIDTGEAQLNYVLDSIEQKGMACPCVYLIGGEPGVGKSTLLTQVYGYVGQKYVAYYSAGEESPNSIALRTQRVSPVNDLNRQNCKFRRGLSFMRVMNDINTLKPKLVIFDSLQAHLHDKVDPTGEVHKRGSKAQIQPMAKELHDWAHANNAIVFIVSHILKNGEFAVSKMVDHDIDANLMLTHGDDAHVWLTSDKNRFGDTGVAGRFKMGHNGLRSAAD